MCMHVCIMYEHVQNGFRRFLAFFFVFDSYIGTQENINSGHTFKERLRGYYVC